MLFRSTDIIVNAKTQRVSVCNAAETMLVHADIAQRFLPVAAEALRAKNCIIRGCERTRAIIDCESATDADWDTEFLSLTLAVRVVDDLNEALAHIARHSTRHSECIVTEDMQAAERFLLAVDSAAVYHNASTRFTDGEVFGLGAEIGISTQKMHARGPMGLRELCSTKSILRGNGQVRT